MQKNSSLYLKINNQNDVSDSDASDNFNKDSITTDMSSAIKSIEQIIKYIGDNPTREGLKDTPNRVVNSYKELFSGYNIDYKSVLNKKFYDISDYDDIVLLKDIDFQSTCEHHMLPFIGKIHVAYIPDGFVVGISKIVRLIEIFSKRLQIQESLTSQIANALQQELKPKGVAVMISSKHYCMHLRGVKKFDTSMYTNYFTGDFKKDPQLQNKFFTIVK